jgi:uncharacterized protein involved in exopolysaccharide biosynthesis
MTGDSHATLGDYVTPPLRRWPLVAVAAAVGALAGLAWAVGHPADYLSVATVQLEPGQTMTALQSGAGRSPTLSIDTDAQLLLSDEVVSAVATAAAMDADAVRDGLSVQAPALSSTLRVGFRAPAADAAQVGAQVAAEALLSARDDVLATVPDSVARGIRSELALRESSLSEQALQQRVRASLTDDASQLSLVLDRLEAQSTSAVSGRVVSDASTPARENRLLQSPALSTGLGLGAIAGIAATWRLDRRARRYRQDLVPDDCRQLLLVDALRHHRGILVTAAIVGAGAGLLTGISLQPDPTAVTRLLVTPLPGNALAPDDERRNLVQMQNEAQVVRSDPVLSAALRALGRPPEIGPLRRHLAVSVPTGTTTLEVRVRAADPEEAEQASRAIAGAYLQYRGALASDRRADVAAALEQQIESLDRRLQTYLAAGDERFVSRAEVISVRLTEARGELETLSAPAPSGRVLSTRRGSLPGPWLPLVGAVAGLVLGAALGVAGAVGRERMRDLVRHHDCVHRLGAPTVAPVDVAALASSAPAVRSDVQILPAGEVHDDLLEALGLPVVEDATRGCGPILVAVHLGHATHHQVARALLSVREAGRELIGVVVWPVQHQRPDSPGGDPIDLTMLASG